MPDLVFSMQARPRDRDSWVQLARRVEAAGFRGLYAADHPGFGSSPFVSLAAAAAVTDRMDLGTYVSQAGVREPAHLASEAAALAVLAPGRVVLGLGAGHNPAEWASIGRERPSPGDRAARLVEFVDVVARLLQGERVTYEGRHLALRDARIDGADGRVRLLVGGGNPAILRVAARAADVVALSGLGRTLADGRDHEVRWSREDLERQLRIVREEAGRHDRSPVLDALVQVVRVTDDRSGALEELAGEIGAPAADLAGTPFVLVGTEDEMAAQLRRQATEYGITSYVVREPALDPIIRVMAKLQG
jgi:probable F420-dependent oxidoreductase